MICFETLPYINHIGKKWYKFTDFSAQNAVITANELIKEPLIIMPRYFANSQFAIEKFVK